MKWFFNLKIAVKLIIAFVVVAIIAGVVGIVGVINIQSIEKNDTKLYEKMTAPLSDLVVITGSMQRSRGNLRDILLSNTEKEYADYENRIKLRNDEREKAHENFAKTLLTDEGRKASEEFDAACVEYDKYALQIIALKKAGRLQDAITLLRGDGDVSVKKMEEKLKILTDLKVKVAKETSQSNVAQADSSSLIMIILIIAGMILAIGLGIFISSIISRPLKQLVVIADKIADGDLNVNVEVKSKDEVGKLALAFDAMVNNVNSVMTNINAASEQVAAGAKQVSSSGQALSQGSTEQASSIEQITSSMTEVAAQTKQNAQNANQANELATSAKENASKGNSQMQEMVKAMADINDSSSNISKIIKVIDEIAFQTNILALNAAVEAARAGQHGKGFAVVAEEVRNLAARSANAAKETTVMIEGSIKKVEIGTKIANETATALNSIVDGIAKAAAIVGNIATASNEQATGISQINQAIDQVAQVVQTNSATAEESASASEELSSQAELLKESVRKFKLKKATNITHSNYETLSPEVIRMIESMISKKNNSIYEIPKKVISLEATHSQRPKISLDESDFGKY